MLSSEIVPHVSDNSVPKIKTNDGVFYNLNAKPEIIKIEDVALHLDKPPTYSQAALNMPPSYQDALDDVDAISGLVIDGYEVGHGGIFLLHCLASILFHVFGLIVGMLLSRSYAGLYGSISGFGVIIIFYSLTIEENHAIDPNVRSGLGITLFILGYAAFMLPLFLYQQVVERAKEIHRNNFV